MRLPILLLMLAACACARTATRTPAVTTAITGLTDKDARHKAMVHPAFANAGQRSGVELWRIENFNPVAVSQNDVGKFYKGDSYIVLKTTADKRNNLSWDIHYWIGSASTQDEAGAAAILTVGLDDKFGGAAIQHRETLGHESAQFLGYFQPAIRYLDGGHASGFNHVTTNAGAEKRLFQIKGKRNVRVRQVDPLISSMNKGDCFILDKDRDIYVYVGAKAKNVEKLKAISVANQIRDQDHNGRGRVEILDQYSTDTDIQKFFTALGSGTKDSVPEESAGGDDQAFEKSEEQTVTLSEISDSTGSLKITPLPKPFRQEQLKPTESYILDTVSGSIYVWVGKQSTEREKTEAMSKAQQYLSSKNYPSWVHVSRIPQGTEPAAFKQYFSTWRDVGMSHSRIVRSLSGGDVSKISSTEAWRERVFERIGSARLFETDIFRDNTVVFGGITNFNQNDLHSEKAYVLDSGDELYVWIGKNTADHLKKSGYKIAEAYLRRGYHTGSTVAVVVKQGLEPELFKTAFEDWDPQMWMVALIFGVNGACRGNELVNMKVNNIEKHEELLLINLRDTKTNSERSFIIREEYARIVEKYQALRPSNINTNRFFIGYSNGKCTRHVIGKNKISAMPKEIAKYLNLPNPELYTGYCFRRTSASLLADSGADMAQIKCHGGWKSEAVAEVYIENPIENNISCGIDDNIDMKTPYIISDPWKPLPPQPSTSKYILSSPLLEAPPSPTFKMEPNDPQTQGSDVFTAAQINSISTNISIPEQKCNYIFT